LLKVIASAALSAAPFLVQAGLVSVAAGQNPAGEDETVVLAPSQRRAPDAPPAPPPALPPGAGQVTPLTIEAAIEVQPPNGPARRIPQTITRTADRVHISTPDGREWFFERNVRDERRAFGFLVEHSKKAIVVYDESDLRNMLGMRGWADVLTMGLDWTLLDSLKPTGEERTLGGFRFARYASDDESARVREVWWSVDQALASSLTAKETDGVTTQLLVERIEDGVAADRLLAPASRFPSYRVVDLADWLEHPGH
jgi:hypothetical protein